MDMSDKKLIDPFKQNVVLVTGLSGAGRSTCLKILEDYGFEAIDNIPISFIPALLSHSSSDSVSEKKLKIAIGIDVRTRDFDEQTLLDSANQVTSTSLSVSIVFLDCDNDTLIKRFTETRRKHPLSDGLPVIDGIRIERKLLSGICAKADLMIDTSHLTLSQLNLILNKLEMLT